VVSIPIPTEQVSQKSTTMSPTATIEARSECPLSKFAKGFSRSDRKPAYHAMLECYFDDSSDERKERHCASGGFFGTDEQWDAFEMMWSNETHGLKEPFRSTDCECGHAQFKEWPKPSRDALMARLVSVIQVAKLAGFASIVPVKAYRAAFPDCKEDDPYLLTIPHAIMNMAVIGERMGTDINFWFERGRNDAAGFDFFRSIQKLNWIPSQRLRAIASDTKKLRPLQSADFVAREAFKHIDNLGVRPMRKPLERLGERVFFIAWTEGALRYLAAHGGPQNQELLAHWDEIPDAPKLAQHSLWLAIQGE